ncbi:MAG: dethiobiotin synthase [bacterium]
MRVFFITGTDTDVGKTFVSSLIINGLKYYGKKTGYLKPIETGVKLNHDGTKKYIDSFFVKKQSDITESLDEICPFTFELPLSPYAASKFENKSICIKEILYSFYDLKNSHDILIVEGAGGMLVPLKKGRYMIDLAKYMDAEVIIVSRAGLGMLNHTLLSINYAKNNDIKLAGIIINNARNEKDESVLSNKEILAEFTDVPIIGDIPYFSFDERENFRYFKALSLNYIDFSSIL